MLMLKGLIFFILFFINISFAEEVSKNSETCFWDNRTKIPCLEIVSNIPNSSELSKSGIYKTTISKKEIDESGAIDLIDILQSIPSINITQSGPKGQQASMFMGGTGSNHTLVMINGVPINDQSTTQGLHDFGVDFIQTIQQIDVYPGSSATHFGTNAIGGAVNLILTGDFKDNVSFAIDSIDNNENYEFLGNKTFVYDDSSLNFKLGSVKSETVSVKGNKHDEKDALKNYTTNINYENFVNPQLRLHSTTYLRQTIAEYDNSSTNQTGYEGDNIMGSFQLGLENLNQKQKYNYLFYYNFYDREYDERGTIDSYESEVLGLKYDLSKTLNKKVSYGLGSEYKYDWGYFDNNGSYSSSTKGNIDNLALYSNLGINLLDNTNLSFFLRNDKHKQTGNNSTYKINLSQIFGKLELGLSRMTGLRNPSLYELFGSDSTGYSGNRDLNPEKSATNEIYTKYFINKNLSFSSRLFRSHIHDNIEYVSKQYVNDTDNVNLNQSGINSDVIFKIKNTNLKLFSSFLSSKKENESDQLRRPEKNYGFNLTKTLNNNFFGNYNLNILYNHYGKHFDTHSSNWSTVEMDSTDLVDLKITKKNKNYDFYIKIGNLLDENYQRPHGYNQETRNFRFGIKY